MPKVLALSALTRVSHRNALLVLGVALGLAGCAPPAGPWAEREEIRTRDLLDSALARVDTVHTVEVAGRVSVKHGGARFDATHRVLFQRPARYRIDVESKPFLGLFEASLTAFADGDSLVVYSPSYGFVLEASGPGDLGLLGPELSWVALSGVRGVMLGLPNFEGGEPLAPTVRPGKDGAYEISLARPEGTQILWLDPETLSIEKMEIRGDAGALVVASEFSYGSKESLFPERVKVKCPESDAVILLTYSEFQVNGNMDPSAFSLNIPANARRYRPDR